MKNYNKQVSKAIMFMTNYLLSYYMKFVYLTNMYKGNKNTTENIYYRGIYLK